MKNMQEFQNLEQLKQLLIILKRHETWFEAKVFIGKNNFYPIIVKRDELYTRSAENNETVFACYYDRHGVGTRTSPTFHVTLQQHELDAETLWIKIQNEAARRKIGK